MQQKITKRQNERRNPEKVVVVKVNENNELDFVQGNTKNLTGRYYFAVVISIDCALIAFDYKKFIK
jgi:hypothetical protein